MITQPSARGNKLVAKSMKITGSTRLVSVAVAGGVSINAALAIQLVGTTLAGFLLAMLFASITVASWAIAADLCTRSERVISDLRSIGATRSSIFSAVLAPLLSYGVAAAAVGAFAGAAGGELAGGGGYDATTMLIYGALVAATAAAASGLGVYAGVRRSWRS